MSFEIFFQQSEKLSEKVAPLKEFFGINYVAFKRTYNNGEKLFLFNQPKIFENYFKNEYFLIGNRDGAPHEYENSYDTWDSLPDPYGIYKAGLENFGFSHGVSIIKKQDEFCEFFFLASSANNKPSQNFYVNNIDFLEKMVAFIKENASPMIKKLENYRIQLPYIGHEAYQLEKQYKQQFSQKYQEFQQKFLVPSQSLIKHELLSKRETQCLHLLQQGMTNKEIAKSLGISYRTVEDYIHNIKLKLNCKNRIELAITTLNFPLK